MKEKYEQMKENIRNKNELSENSKENSRSAKNVRFVCVYKMVKFSKNTWEKNAVEVIVFNGKKWLNQKNIEDQLKHPNLPAAHYNILQSLENKENNYKIVASISLVEDL